ncbi:MAG: AbrB/MazE/SpoVT family DNA-binding domain-containing protein [Oscillospiraceae bacterium]|nr:AbrB/MazE/SpoVT family DNA-binding domain-containing protein [Oscillospiraceae bacterium]
MGNQVFPEGKLMAPVKVGPKGQIVIPAEVREMFGIRPGDTLLLLADKTEGIALPEQNKAREMFDKFAANFSIGGNA